MIEAVFNLSSFLRDVKNSGQHSNHILKICETFYSNIDSISREHLGISFSKAALLILGERGNPNEIYLQNTILFNGLTIGAVHINIAAKNLDSFNEKYFSFDVVPIYHRDREWRKYFMPEMVNSCQKTEFLSELESIQKDILKNHFNYTSQKKLEQSLKYKKHTNNKFSEALYKDNLDAVDYYKNLAESLDTKERTRPLRCKTVFLSSIESNVSVDAQYSLGVFRDNLNRIAKLCVDKRGLFDTYKDQGGTKTSYYALD